MGSEREQTVADCRLAERKLVPLDCQHDRREHSCGCVTVFDLRAWKSVAFRRCEEHTR